MIYQKEPEMNMGDSMVRRLFEDAREFHENGIIETLKAAE